MSTTLKVISSMATRQLLADLAAQFEQRSGIHVAVESVGGVDAAKRVQADEAFDVVVLAANAIDTLIAAGKVVADTRIDLVHSGVAVAVRAGAPHADIRTEEAMKQAVLNAHSIGYSTGPSGVQLIALFERWGIKEQLGARLVQAPPGVPVGSLVTEGKIELGFQQLSELMNLPGINVLGPLPDSIQIVTTFAAAQICESRQDDAVLQLLRFATSLAADETKHRNGMSPVQGSAL